MHFPFLDPKDGKQSDAAPQPGSSRNVSVSSKRPVAKDPPSMSQRPETPRRNAITATQPSTHAHPNAPTHCAAALEADRKVEVLGSEVVNPLERRVADLEDLDLDRRVDTLFQRLKPYEEYRELAEEAVAKLKGLQQSAAVRQAKVGLDVVERIGRLEKGLEEVQEALTVQESGNARSGKRPDDIAQLTARVQQLEAQALESSSSDTNALALDLLGRLQNGDAIHAVLAKQIQLALSNRRSSASSEVPDRDKQGPEKNAATPINGVTKRRGRPLKHGRYARKGVATDELRKLIAESDAASSARSSLSSASSASPSVPETQQQGGDVKMTDRGEKNGGEHDESSDETDDPPFIPGERKSARKPKPRTFIDQVDWKDVSGKGSVSSP